MFKKKSEKIHKALQSKVYSYLVKNEDVYCDARVGNQSYFVTENRVIVLFSASHKCRGVNCKSYNYSEMLDVQYLDTTTKRIPFDTINVKLNGGMFNTNVHFTLPQDVARTLYGFIINYKN